MIVAVAAAVVVAAAVTELSDVDAVGKIYKTISLHFIKTLL